MRGGLRIPLASWEESMESKKDLYQNDFLRGLKAGIPIALGYIPIAIAFGLLAKANGVPLMIAFLLSFLVFAGASQFVAVQMMSAGALWGSIVLFTFLLNSRHLLMSATISARLTRSTWWQRAIIAFGITDESFSVASLSSGKLTFPYLFSLNGIAYLSWVLGTILGFSAGSLLPNELQSSMGIALYAMFIALIVPAMKGSRLIFFTVVGSALLNWILSHFLPGGISIILSTLIFSGFATLIATTTKEKDGLRASEERGGEEIELR